MDAFCAAIAHFYKKELHCGDVVVGRLMDRAHGTQLVTIHAKDLATTQLKFVGGVLARGVEHPTIHMALEYSQRTGAARTLIKGGEKYHTMLANAFAGTAARFCVVSFDSDWLYPTAESRHLVHALNAAGAPVSFVELSAPFGHDSFLLDVPALDRVIEGFLSA